MTRALALSSSARARSRFGWLRLLVHRDADLHETGPLAGKSRGAALARGKRLEHRRTGQAIGPANLDVGRNRLAAEAACARFGRC